jgi:hypothetical protein
VLNRIRPPSVLWGNRYTFCVTAPVSVKTLLKLWAQASDH